MFLQARFWNFMLEVKPAQLVEDLTVEAMVKAPVKAEAEEQMYVDSLIR
jgi:hypothetical protein